MDAKNQGLLSTTMEAEDSNIHDLLMPAGFHTWVLPG